MAAEKVTPDAVNFMARHGRGLICSPLTEERAEQLGLQRMVLENRESYRTDFTVSVDAARGVTTGISAHDRARTIQVLVDAKSTPQDSASQQIFLHAGSEARRHAAAGGPHGGERRPARLAGLKPAGVRCEILNADVAPWRACRSF